MASTETQHRGSSRGMGRLLRRKKDPDSRHPLIHPTTSDSVGPAATRTAHNGKKKNSHRGLAFRGLGCAFSSSSSSAAASPEALVPASAAAAAVRSSAEWREKGAPKKRRGAKKKAGRGGAHTVPADVADVWCAPGVVFGAEAPVDCVVAHRRERIHRERPCNSRRGIDEEIISSFLDCPYGMEMQHFASRLLHPEQLRYMRGGYGGSPAEFDEEMMMFQTRAFLGGLDVQDPHKDLRLDVDSMSYEELLELSERIGYVSTGLREEEIIRNLRKPKHSFFGVSPSKEWKCIICQEEYEANDDMGRLECGHAYHTHCIKQWLLQKNSCPVCKAAVTKN